MLKFPPSLKKRLIYSSILIPVTLAAIFFSPLWFFFVIVLTFAMLGLWEFFVMAEKKGVPVNRYLGLGLGLALAISFWYSNESLILAFAVLITFCYYFHPSRRDQALVGASVTIFGIIYAGWLFFYLLKLRQLDHGAWWIFYTILIVKAGDAGAYFTGSQFGRQKLIEHISPNKSVEGALGGLATSVILSLGSKIYLTEVPFSHLFFLGIVLGVFSQLGDLAESLIKRDVGVKDSGEIPGLGGIMDVIDSLILTIPFVYYYIVLFNPYGI